MVTAETAVVLPVLLLVLAAAVAAVTAVGGQLRCVDAAREGARAAARGETVSVVTELASRAAPDGAVVTIADEGEAVRVSVAARIPLLGSLPVGVPVEASAVGMREPGPPGPAG